MSVLIKGMKLPKNCKECPFCKWSNHYQIYVCFDGNRYTEMFFDGKYPTESALRSKRADNCPMTVLPAQHGRLIDADALLASNLGGEPFKSVIRRVLLQAPTIIEEVSGE